MKNFIIIEWLKWRSYKPFITGLAIYISMFFLICFGMDEMLTNKFASNFGSNDSIPKQLIKQYNPYGFPHAWHVFTYIGKFFKIILALVIINVVCYEFQNGTFKQSIIHGLKRYEFLYGKLLLIICLSLISTLTIFSAILFGGISYSDLSEIAFMENIHFLLLSFINTFTYLSMAVMFAILLKNPITAFIVLMLSWFPGDLLLLSIIPLDLAIYRPFEVIDELLPFTKHEVPIWKLVSVCFTYLCIYWSISLFKLKKDLT